MNSQNSVDQQEQILPKPIKLPDNYEININQTLDQLEKEILDLETFKYKIQESEDRTIKCLSNSRLRVQYEERDESGKLVHPDRQVNEQVIIKMATTSPMMTGLRKAFLSMCQGDQAWFRIKNNENQIKYFKIKVISINQPAGMLDLGILENRFIQLEKFRVEGNNLFKKGMYEQACKRYQKGINFLDKWPKSSESNNECQKRKQQFYLIFCSNIAQCYMGIKEYKKAIIILQDILGQCRNNNLESKNFYRLIKSLIEVSEYDDALRYLKELRYLKKLNEEETALFNELQRKIIRIRRR